MNINRLENITIGKIADLPFYTEGPANDSKGNLYCTTLSGGSILKIDAANNLSEWGHSPCPNGQIVVEGDDHLVCDVRLRAISRFDTSGKFIKNEIEGFCSGMPIFSPNDLVADSEGNIYFTDSIRNKGKVCFLGADGKQAILLANLDYPNGLVLSRDQSFLYVAESYKNRIIVIDIASPGIRQGSFKVFSELPKHHSGKEQDNLPDGLTMDSEGNLWVAHYGMQAVHKFSPEGSLLYSINTTMPFTSNLIFINQKTLIITGGYGEPGPGALFKISL